MHTASFMERCADRYGEVFSVAMAGTDTGVWISDPAAIKRLYARDKDNQVPPGTRPAIEPMFGPASVFLAAGAAHARKRRLLMPPFHGDRLATWRERMTEAAEREVDGWNAPGPLTLGPRMAAVTEEIMFEVVFGLGEGPRQRQLRAALTSMVDASMRPGALLLGFFAPSAWTRRLRPTPWGRLQRSIERTHALLREEIRTRRSDPGLEGRQDVFSLLAQAKDETGQPIGEEELLDELMSLLLAGAESSATTLTWALHHLLRHPEACERLSSELDDGEGRYLDAVLQETMRLRPVAHLTARRVTSPFEVSGYSLPAGTTVVVPAYVVHHRADLYPDPKAFRPERFLEKPPGAFTWLPFGGGARRCVGASFAMLEMRCVLATIVRRVSMRPARDAEERVTMRNIILTPSKRGRVIVDRVTPGGRAVKRAG